jgi:hypothetical protein
MPSYQNPKFDKKQYWYRRNRGWRGQFDAPTEVGRHFYPDWLSKPVSKKAFMKNTKRARKEQ